MKKKCLIIANTYNKESTPLAEQINRFLLNHDVVCDIFLFSGHEKQCSCKGYDFAVTLGGDGTVLFAARGCAEYAIPIFAVNLGLFGFIAGVQKEECFSRLELFLDGLIPVVERSMLYATILRKNQNVFESYALNDIVISTLTPVSLISLDVSYDGIPFGFFKADGLILATSTGSTSYSVAAGGPIIDPALNVIVLSPICPFSLSNRPVVLPACGMLELHILPSRDTGSILKADGQSEFTLCPDDIVQITVPPRKALLADCTREKFYSALRSKLHWSGGVNA